MRSEEKKHQPFIDAWRDDIMTVIQQSGIFKLKTHDEVVSHNPKPEKIILEYLLDPKPL
jgi:hypothetical protein